MLLSYYANLSSERETVLELQEHGSTVTVLKKLYSRIVREESKVEGAATVRLGGALCILTTFDEKCVSFTIGTTPDSWNL